MPKSLLTLVLLLAAALPVAGCNTPGSAAKVHSSSWLESADYTEAMGKIRTTAERLDQLLTSQKLEPAKYEALVLLNLVDRVKQFTPTNGVATSADYVEFLGRAEDMYASASKMLHFTSLHREQEALDVMEIFVKRYNRVSTLNGPGGQMRKLSRPAGLLNR